MINQAYVDQAFRYLMTRATKLYSLRLMPGLSNHEIETIEQRHGFTFPLDLRLLLQTALPLTDDTRDFPNWRDGDAWLEHKLADPFSCVEYGVSEFDFWWKEWGKRPKSPTAAVALAADFLAAMPKLIPVYAHRYLPSIPTLAGNPVMSLVDFDFIYYGHDLPSYLAAEFGVPNPYPVPALPRYIPMWAEAVEATGGWSGPTAVTY